MISPTDLNFRHLRGVAAIVSCGNMSVAAGSVSLSQPALTQGLAKLEAQLGTALFHRRPDGMAATLHGSILAGRVERGFARLADATKGIGRGSARPDRRITATQLRAFLALADGGGFQAAAALTASSQPAVHRAVRELEQVLALPLAVRQGRGVAVTETGQRVAQGFRLCVGEIAAAIAEIVSGGEAGLPIRLGAMPLCRARLLPSALAGLVRSVPDVRVSVMEGAWGELVEKLRCGAIDLMIGALRAPYPDLVQTPLFLDRLIVVCGPHHPLASARTGGGTEPDLDHLSRYPWIVGPAGSPLRLLWEGLWAGRRPPQATIECGSVMTLRGILRETEHLTLLSPDQVLMELAAGLLARIGPPLESCVRTIGVTCRADWRPTPLQQLALDLLAAAATTEAVPDF